MGKITLIWFFLKGNIFNYYYEQMKESVFPSIFQSSTFESCVRILFRLHPVRIGLSTAVHACHSLGNKLPWLLQGATDDIAKKQSTKGHRASDEAQKHCVFLLRAVALLLFLIFFGTNGLVFRTVGFAFDLLLANFQTIFEFNVLVFSFIFPLFAFLYPPVFLQIGQFWILKLIYLELSWISFLCKLYYFFFASSHRITIIWQFPYLSLSLKETFISLHFLLLTFFSQCFLLGGSPAAASSYLARFWASCFACWDSWDICAWSSTRSTRSRAWYSL